MVIDWKRIAIAAGAGILVLVLLGLLTRTGIVPINGGVFIFLVFFLYVGAGFIGAFKQKNPFANGVLAGEILAIINLSIAPFSGMVIPINLIITALVVVSIISFVGAGIAFLLNKKEN